MKKLIVLLLVVLATAVFAQNNITNTLGTAGFFYVKDASNTFFTIQQSNGNVGIGTAAPAYNLDVQKTDYPTVRIKSINANTGYYGQLLFEVPNGHTGLSSGSIKGLSTNSSTADMTLTFSTTSGTDANIYERMRIDPTGNVGIGTTNPATKLDVTGYVQFASSLGTYPWQLRTSSGADYMYIYDPSQSAYRLTIDNAGYVGIGTTTPAEKLDVAGNIKISNQSGPVTTPDKIDLGASYSNGATNDQLKIYLYDNGGDEKYGFGIGIYNDIQYHSRVSHDFYINNAKSFSVTASGGANSSDRRLKRDILPLSKYGLKQVMQLNPVTYIFKADGTNTHQVGFIAQEVQQIIPEVVTGKEGDLSKGESLGIVYGNLVPVLTKAIQEQQKIIEELKERISKLENK